MLSSYQFSAILDISKQV